jgi:hypothetical protein
VSVGLFGPDRLQWATGGPVRLLPVYVFIKDTSTLAVLYGDPNGLSTIANPTWTDHYGELTFFAELGEYDLWANDSKVATIEITDSTETVGVTEDELNAATRFVWDQVQAEKDWLIPHPLKYNPAGVHVINSAGDPILPAFDYPISNQQVRISFASPESGKAYLS